MADRNSLLERWQDAFGAPAPKNTSVQLLRKALAHEAQCKAFGTPLGRGHIHQILPNPSSTPTGRNLGLDVALPE